MHQRRKPDAESLEDVAASEDEERRSCDAGSKAVDVEADKSP